jgi:hypothetical protein
MSDRRRRPPLPAHLLFGGPIYPGNGYPPRPGEDRPGLSPFGRLAMGQTLGKSSILIYDDRLSKTQAAAVDMITIEGDDLDSQQLVLTLHPPRVIPLSFEAVQHRLDQQNLTGEQTNGEVTVGSFPGTTTPIRWPPLEAHIEFGTGGVNVEAVVDYNNGITLTLQASYLRVFALVTQSGGADDLIIGGTSAAYYLAAHVGPGFAESHAQRTIFLGTVADGGSSPVVEVPKFAKIATLIGTTGGTPATTIGFVSFYQSPDGTNGIGDFFVSGQNRVEVPNAAQYFRVFNTSGHPMKMSTVFELSL